MKEQLALRNSNLNIDHKFNSIKLKYTQKKSIQSSSYKQTNTPNRLDISTDHRPT